MSYNCGLGYIMECSMCNIYAPINPQNNWSSGWNVDFGYKRLTVRTPASICFLLEQETLSVLLQSTQL